MPKVVDHEARRHEISGIVAGLIAKGGLEAATIREIARSSGYSKGVVEHYFDGKEGLISGALAWVNQCYEERVSQATRGLSGLPALRKMLEATLPLTAQVRDEWKVRLVFWAMAAIDPALRRQQAKRLDAAIVRYESLLRSATERGEIGSIDDYENAARHLLNITTGICTAALHQKQRYTRDFLNGEIDYVIQGFAVEN
jgi:AcrR family transcriptional regulator